MQDFSTLGLTLAACAAATCLSIGLAAWVSMGRLARLVDRMVSFSAGMLLGTALLHLLPESMHLGTADVHDIAATLLAGLLSFFFLERFSLLRHDHHHEHDGHHHEQGHDARSAGKGGTSLLIGSSVHALADGVLIAAAFHLEPFLGLMTALAVATHEVPQQLSNFFVLLNSGFSRSRALLFNLLTGCGALVGGVIGSLFLGQAQMMLPYVLSVAASSFVYIALSDLIPQLHAQAHSHEHGGQRRAAWFQPALMILGVALAALATYFLHGY